MVTAAAETRTFFDGMAPRYDADLRLLGWDPIRLLAEWPFIVPPLKDVLDAGCGTGALLETLAGAGRELTGLDISPVMLDKARNRRPIKGIELHCANAGESWPIADESTDVVLALAMFEFVEHLDVALDELHRVLRIGGRALFTVEDRVDWGGVAREAYEHRYGEVSLWRRTREEVEASMPPGLEIVRCERVRGYEVLELGFVTSYWVVEAFKP